MANSQVLPTNSSAVILPTDIEKYWIQPSSWDKASSSYNNAVGMSSQLATPRLVELAHALSPLDAPTATVIDLGAGTGSLTHALSRGFPTLPVLATDISTSMLVELEATQPYPDRGMVTTQTLDMLEPSGVRPPEGFSHVFSSMALQAVENPEDPNGGVAWKWMDLLRPGGVLALAIWDFDERCGPQEIWEASVRVVDPGYFAPPLARERQWVGHKNLEDGIRKVGCEDVTVEVFRIGIDVGTDEFLRFVWESGNPWALERIGSFGGDQEKVREAMGTVLKERYKDGMEIPLYAALAVGRKPLNG